MDMNAGTYASAEPKEGRLRTSLSMPNLSGAVDVQQGPYTKLQLPPSILLSTAIDSSPSLCNSSLSDSSTPGGSALKIQFAPFPEVIRGSRRRNRRPAGVANRQALLREARRQYSYDQNAGARPRGRPLEAGNVDEHSGALRQEEEALDVISEMLKEVGRTIWRKLLRKGSKELRSSDVEQDTNAATQLIPPRALREDTNDREKEQRELELRRNPKDLSWDEDFGLAIDPKSMTIPRIVVEEIMISELPAIS